jgi:acyl-CoA thioesterase
VSRSTGLLDLLDPALRRTDNLVWLRVEGELPDDPPVHVCLMTYASDLTLLDSVLLAPPPVRPGPQGGALS